MEGRMGGIQRHRNQHHHDLWFLLAICGEREWEDNKQQVEIAHTCPTFSPPPAPIVASYNEARRKHTARWRVQPHKACRQAPITGEALPLRSRERRSSCGRGQNGSRPNRASEVVDTSAGCAEDYCEGEAL